MSDLLVETTAPEPAVAKVLRFLTKAEILAADDRKYEVVDVPEWGGAVRIQSLSGVERDAFETAVTKYETVDGKTTPKMDTVNMRAKLVAMGVVDEDGHKLFTIGEAQALGQKSNAALDRCFQAISKLSGMGEEGKKAAGEGSAQTQ